MKKSRLLVWILPFICTCSLLSCSSTEPPMTGDTTTSLPIQTTDVTTEEKPNVHTHAFGEWVTMEEATCTLSGKQERSCTCGEIETQTINALGHTEVVDPAIVTACTKWSLSAHIECAVCHTILQEREWISPKEHHYVDQTCVECNNQQIDYTDIGLYASNEGYTFFETASNGAAMRKLYEEMENVLTEFHHSNTINASYYLYNEELGDLFEVAAFNYVQYGLTLDEAQTVYTVFRKDHPVFYWMSYWLYWQGGSIVITTVEEYASGADRSHYNQILYEGIEEYVSLAEGETSAYNIALIYYDAILKNNTYAYTANGGVEPAQWAHSIMGDFLYGKFVCEGYSKLFQLLLNVSGVENMFICGDANGSHLWNLIRMDDGNWYWFDPTWGDEMTDPYRYFCILDNAMTTHTPTPSNRYGMYFNITLPSRADTPFEHDEILEIGEVFTVDDCEYVLTSAGTVKPVGGAATSIDKLLYRGVIYHIAE